MRPRYLLALFPLLAACTGKRATHDEYVNVVRQAVAFIQEDTRTHNLGRPSSGPRWVDVKGFAKRAAQATGDTIPVARMMQLLGRPRIADPNQVLLIDSEEQGGLGGTWVREYGTYVSPNVMRATEDQITMIVVGYVTDRRAFPTTICDRVWRLRYRKRGEVWGLSEKQLMRECGTDRR
jgi:hypothetical protein